MYICLNDIEIQNTFVYIFLCKDQNLINFCPKFPILLPTYKMASAQ